MEKRYDRRDLVLAYIEANKKYYPGDDTFEQFAKDRLAALEQAFGVSLTHQGVRNRQISAMIMLFDRVACTNAEEVKIKNLLNKHQLPIKLSFHHSTEARDRNANEKNGTKENQRKSRAA